MRNSILRRSVARLLDSDETLGDVVVLTSRHRWFLPYAVVSAMALYVVASVAGIEGTANRVGIAAAGAAIAGLATTHYRILARTDRSLVLLRSSRIRQYATAVLRRLPADSPLTMVGSTVITSDWRVDGAVYTLTKRWEAAMRRVAAGT